MADNARLLSICLLTRRETVSALSVLKIAFLAASTPVFETA